MERILRVEVRAPTASFRRPWDHNYQRTLPLPPPTTLVGIAGAALGMSSAELWSARSPCRYLKVAAWMDAEPGHAQDVWTLLKIRQGRMERSPYVRELLFFVRYTLVYGGDEDFLLRLQEAFYSPVYPLSLGREDEMLVLERTSLEVAEAGHPFFYGTVIPGDIRKMEFRPQLEPGSHMEPPLVDNLPLRFDVDAKGVRNPVQPLATLSFLPFSLKVYLPQVRAISCLGRSFAWMNS